MILATPGALTTVDTAAKYTLGQRTWDHLGNEYVYVQGVADCTAAMFVMIGAAHVLVLGISSGFQQGGVYGVTISALVANTYGWVMVKGTTDCLVAASDAKGTQQYLTATAGVLDDEVTANKVKGLVLNETVTDAAAAEVTITYPTVFIDLVE